MSGKGHPGVQGPPGIKGVGNFSYSGYSGWSGLGHQDPRGASGYSGYRATNCGPGYGSQPVDMTNGFAGLLLESKKWWTICDLSNDEEDLVSTLARHSGPRPWMKISDLANKLQKNANLIKVCINQLNTRYPHLIYEANGINMIKIDGLQYDTINYEVSYWENYIDYMDAKGYVKPGANYANQVKKVKGNRNTPLGVI